MGFAASRSRTRSTTINTDNRQDNSVSSAFDAQGQELEGDLNNLNFSGARGDVSIVQSDHGSIGRSFDFVESATNGVFNFLGNTNRQLVDSVKLSQDRDERTFKETTRLLAQSSSSAAAGLSIVKWFVPVLGVISITAIFMGYKKR